MDNTFMVLTEEDIREVVKSFIGERLSVREAVDRFVLQSLRKSRSDFNNQDTEELKGSRKARGNYHATVKMGGNSFCGLGSSGGSAGSAGSAGYAVSAGSAGSSGSSGNVLSSITSGLSSLASIAAPIISQISPQRAPALVIVKKKGLTIDGKTISPTMIVIGIGAVGVILFMVAQSGKKHSVYSTPTTV